MSVAVTIGRCVSRLTVAAALFVTVVAVEIFLSGQVSPSVAFFSVSE